MIKQMQIYLFPNVKTIETEKHIAHLEENYINSLF